MGIKPYMLAPALNLIVGQRLLRKLHTCSTMREASTAESHEIKAMMATMHDIAPRMELTFDERVPHAV